MERNELSSTPSVRLPSAGSLLHAKNCQGTNRIIASSLSVLEEVLDEHEAALRKLKAALPTQYHAYVDLANPITDTRFDALRARILKVANDSKRDLDEQIDALRVE